MVSWPAPRQARPVDGGNRGWIAPGKLRGVCLCITGVHGNAATRMSQYVPTDGVYANGGWPDLNALFTQQARERSC
jgi:hypothetical protein